jgi:large subunit ribosomal protein L1
MGKKTSEEQNKVQKTQNMATAQRVYRHRDRLVRRVLLSLQIQQRAHSSLFSSTSYSYSSSAAAAAAVQTEEEEKKKKKSDVFVAATRLPRPIFDHHRRREEEEEVLLKNEDGTTKPIHDVLSAVRWAKEDAKTKKFDQTVEMSIRLGVNPKRSDMIVRGTCNLPNGTGKKFYVLTFAENEEDREMAREAGADAVGGEELIEQIKSGKFEDLNKVNVCIATPGIVAKLKSSGLARTLGPKGLMPNPKVGTLTAEVGKAVRDAKSGGRVEYRAEKNAIVHAGIGKTSFEDVAIVENATCLMASVLQNRPKGKGAPAMSNYIKKVYLSTTMGKGSRRIDAKELIKLAEEFTQRSK